MRQSATYQLILKEGFVEGEALGEARGEARGKAEGEARALRRTIVTLVRRHLGAAPARLAKRLEALDVAALDGLLTRLIEAETPAAMKKLLPR